MSRTRWRSSAPRALPTAASKRRPWCSAPRASASAWRATACFFGVLARDEYTRFVKKEQEAQLQHVIDYYAHNPFLQDARADMILHMAHVSQVKRWGKGDVIMATGDPVDGVLFLKSGQVMIRCEAPFAFCRRPC